MTNGPDRQLSALMKGLTVLEAVASHQRISELAQETGLSVSTVHRVLTDLVDHGWVEQESDRSYQLGLRSHRLATQIRKDEWITRSATPHLQRLRDTVGVTVHMARFHQDALMYVAKIDGPAAYQMRSRVGDTIPLWSSAIGKSVLAHLEPSESRRLLDSVTLTRHTPSTIMSKTELWAEIQLAAERGWAVDNEENELGIRCVGTVLRDSDGNVLGGISASGLDHEMTPERIEQMIPHVLEAGKRISSLT